MSKTSGLCGLLSLIFASSISCADQHNSLQSLRQSGRTDAVHGGQVQFLAQDTVTVIDEKQQPVAGATVLFGYDIGNPFPGNTLTTDNSGVTAIPADWKAALPLTVQAPGYVTTTIPVATPGTLTVQIAKQESANEYEVKGTATDFGRLITDGKVDFGLVIPALSRQQMLSFDLSTVLSPKTDTISIIGNDIAIPSNITLPDQSETYIFPIDFNKPDYRVYLREKGTYQMFAMHGQFPLQRVVGDIRAGKSLFEVINYFNFSGGGQAPVDVQGNLSGINVAVNQIAFDKQVNVKAPAYPTTQIMVSLALMEQNGLFMPTDLKRLTPSQSMNLKSVGNTPSVISLLLDNTTSVTSGTLAKGSVSIADFSPLNLFDSYFAANGVGPKKGTQDFSRMSFAILPAAGGVSPTFLPLTAKPSFNNQLLKMDVPALPAGLTAVATYMVMSEIETFTAGSVKSERRTRLWEVWSGAWLQQVELPQISFTRKPDRKYRWEVMFLARPSNFISESILMNTVDLQSVTHVTRNALDI